MGQGTKDFLEEDDICDRYNLIDKIIPKGIHVKGEPIIGGVHSRPLPIFPPVVDKSEE